MLGHLDPGCEDFEAGSTRFDVESLVELTNSSPLKQYIYAIYIYIYYVICIYDMYVYIIYSISHYKSNGRNSNHSGKKKDCSSPTANT